MNFLEERILKDGIVKEGNVLKVDSFLNHQMDINLFKQMGEEFKPVSYTHLDVYKRQVDTLTGSKVLLIICFFLRHK